MKKLLTLLALVFPVLLLQAETREERSEKPHEVRLLVGDFLFESLIWYDDAHLDYTNVGGPASTFTEKQHTYWLPHMGVEYLYRLYDWCSLGAQVDFQYTGWKKMTYDSQNQLISQTPQGFYNLSLMPTIRFTYLHHPYVNLYSSVSFGMDINGGSEIDIRGKHTAVGAALDVAVIGISVDKGHWFGTIEGGGLSALKNKGTMFMLMSRLLTVGVGYRF